MDAGPDAAPTVGAYLIERLYALGARHVFGVPGDFVLRFYDELSRGPLHVINTCDEQGAGFAADAYARLRGIGVVCVTYGVGGLKLANTTAQAFAEKSPVVVLSGAPGLGERERNPLLHHKVRDFDTQLNVFRQFTVASTGLTEPDRACEEIDRVLATMGRQKRPVYVELPRDVVGAPAHLPTARPAKPETSDPEALREALDEATAMLRAAQQPVVLAGVELHRFGLQDKLLELLERTNLPVAETALSKSVVAETHPSYLGVYWGSLGKEGVREHVESADCLLMLGALMTDVDLGLNTARLDPGRAIYVTSDRLAIRRHVYEDVRMADFLQGLIDAELEARPSWRTGADPAPAPFAAVPGRRVTVARLFERLQGCIDERTVLVADVGEALFASLDLAMYQKTAFLSPAYYTSMGFAVPGAVGAQLARPHLRPLVVVGDGAFQMTGMELATVARYALTPVVLVLNNGGYGTERPMLDGPYNDVHPWRYSHVPDVLGAGRGVRVETEDQLERALADTACHPETFWVIEIQLDPHDMSPGLQRLTRALGARVR